jgi:AhpD family alkylhydroperoxidase
MNMEPNRLRTNQITKGEFMANLKPRMKNPVMVVPDALQHLLAIGSVAKNNNLPDRTIGLVHLRASQVNGCGFCVDMHARDLKKAGETDERLWAVAAWRESPHFTDAERAALALAEAATRLSDRSDAVPDEVWNEASRYYDEPALAALILQIALINFWNRVNVTIRQVAGAIPAEASHAQEQRKPKVA